MGHGKSSGKRRVQSSISASKSCLRSVGADSGYSVASLYARCLDAPRIDYRAEDFLRFLSFLVQGKRGPDFPQNYEPLNG